MASKERRGLSKNEFKKQQDAVKRALAKATVKTPVKTSQPKTLQPRNVVNKYVPAPKKQANLPVLPLLSSKGYQRTTVPTSRLTKVKNFAKEIFAPTFGYKQEDINKERKRLKGGLEVVDNNGRTEIKYVKPEDASLKKNIIATGKTAGSIAKDVYGLAELGAKAAGKKILNTRAVKPLVNTPTGKSVLDTGKSVVDKNITPRTRKVGEKVDSFIRPENVEEAARVQQLSQLSNVIPGNAAVKASTASKLSGKTSRILKNAAKEGRATEEVNNVLRSDSRIRTSENLPEVRPEPPSRSQDGKEKTGLEPAQQTRVSASLDLPKNPTRTQLTSEPITPKRTLATQRTLQEGDDVIEDANIPEIEEPTVPEIPKVDRSTYQTGRLFSESDEDGIERFYVNRKGDNGEIITEEIGSFDESGQFQYALAEDGRPRYEVLDEEIKNLAEGRNFGKFGNKFEYRNVGPDKKVATEDESKAVLDSEYQKPVEKINNEVYKGEADLTTTLLRDLEGRSVISKQYLLDATNRGNIKQVEKDLIRKLLRDEGAEVNVPEFARRVKKELLPLKRRGMSNDMEYDSDVDYDNPFEVHNAPKYENITLPEELRGLVVNYRENIYESPIKNTAGSVHFSNSTPETGGYFAHSRVEDTPENTRRVIEIQSDLFQKGRLEGEVDEAAVNMLRDGREAGMTDAQIEPMLGQKIKDLEARMAETSKLEPYRNTWHERVIREELKKAAQDGKTKVQFPTGETAMKIEGLGQREGRWSFRANDDEAYGGYRNQNLKPDNLTIGKLVYDSDESEWIITDVLGDGKFKAVPKDFYESMKGRWLDMEGDNNWKSRLSAGEESFDISGKVDTENPIYKFYEKEVGKYLKNKYGAQRVKDAQGVEWWEIPTTKEMARNPVTAYAQGVGAGGGFINEEGEFDPTQFNLENAAIGLGAGVLGIRGVKKGKGILQNARERKLAEDSVGGFDVDSYVNEMVNAQSIARNIERGGGILSRARQAMARPLADLKKRIVDTNAPIEDTLSRAQEEFGFQSIPRYDITNQIDRVYKAPSIAGQFARDNGLEQVLRDVDDLETFDQYLIAKHARDLEEQGIKTGRDLEKDALLIDSVGPKYVEEEAVVRDYSKKLLDYSVDSGLISREVAESLKAKYPQYVPMKRIFDELEDQGQVRRGSGVASLSSQSVVQKIKGSERQIESPTQSLLEKTNDAFRQGERNKAAEILTSYKDIPGNPFQLERVTGTKNPGDYTVSVLRNGIKETWKTSKEIAEAAKAMNVEQMNIIGRMFAAPVRALKLGATGMNPSFIASNIVRDQLGAFINSKNSVRASVLNPKNFAESLWQALGHGEDYQELVRQGAMQTSFDIGRQQIPSTVRNIRGIKTPGMLEKVKYVASTPAKLFRAAEDLIGRSEEFTRIQQFNAARDAALARGMQMEDALAVAARAARETTTNFARKGEFGTVINNTIPYLNAGIQGTRTNIRNLKQRPLATGSKLAITLGFPVAAVTAYNLKNEDTRAAYEDIPEYEKDRNIIIIPPNPTQDENGDWEVIKIPVTPGHANMAQAGRYAVERLFGLSPQNFGEIATTLLGSVSPVEPTPRGVVSGLTPQAIKPSAEALANQNFYTGFPIVPKSLESLPPSAQTKEGTSATAQKIAGLYGGSPIKTQAFIQGSFAELGLNALNAADNAMSAVGLINPEEVGGRSVSDSVSRRFTRAQSGVQDSIRYAEEEKGEQKKKLENYEKKKTVQPVYDNVQELVKQGRDDEAMALVDGLSDEDYETYKKIRQSVRTKNSTTFKNLLVSNPNSAKEYAQSLGEAEAQRLIDNLSDEEYEMYINNTR